MACFQMEAAALATWVSGAKQKTGSNNGGEQASQNKSKCKVTRRETGNEQQRKDSEQRGEKQTPRLTCHGSLTTKVFMNRL